MSLQWIFWKSIQGFSVYDLYSFLSFVWGVLCGSLGQGVANTSVPMGWVGGLTKKELVPMGTKSLFWQVLGVKYHHKHHFLIIKSSNCLIIVLFWKKSCINNDYFRFTSVFDLKSSEYLLQINIKWSHILKRKLLTKI